MMYCYLLKLKNIPGLVLIMGFEKAFENVSWTFIYKAVDFLNFGPDIKRRVKAFYANANTCVLVNGRYSTWFKIGKVVRQGDSLSTFFYLIFAEVLSIVIKETLYKMSTREYT